MAVDIAVDTPPAGGTLPVLVVCSHVAYDEARSRFLASVADWPRDRVVVVLNGCDLGPGARGATDCGAVEAAEDGSRVVRFARNIYEYTAFLVPRALGADADERFVLVHDTAEAGPRFRELATAAAARSRDLDVLWCSPTGQCNLCVFGRRASDVAHALWLDLQVLHKRTAIQWEHRPGPANLKGQGSLRQAYAPEAARVTGTAMPYSQNVRTRLYFPALDLVKFYINMDVCETHPDRP